MKWWGDERSGRRFGTTQVLGRWVKLLVLLTASTAVLLAQANPGIPIRGVVVGALDGKPVEGVRVYLVREVPSGQDYLSDTRTDAKGDFALSAPAAGEYRLDASAGNRAFGRYPGDPYSDPHKWFQVSTPTSGIVVKLWEGPRVAGLVGDQNDQPVGGVIVQSLRKQVLGGREVLGAWTRAVTGDDGTYDPSVDSPGSYFLAVLPTHRPAGWATPVRYYPSATIASLATPLELEAGGAMREIDFRLQRERGFVVKGIMDLPPGRTGSQLLRLYPASSDALPSSLEAGVTALKNGRFAFPPVPPGSYEIHFVSHPQLPAGAPRDGTPRSMMESMFPARLALVPDGPTWWVRQRVDVVDDDVAIALQLRKGVHVSGRVVFTGPAPKPDPSLLRTRGVYLRSVDYPPFPPGPLGPAREDGTFQTLRVPPGRYVLRTYTVALGNPDPYPGFQLASVRIEGREVGGLSFELDHDITNAVLTFSSQVTAVSGHLTGASGEDKFVLIWPHDETQWSGSGTQLERIYRTVVTGDSFSVHVFPGKYRVVALAGLPPPDWESPAFLRSVAHLSQPVTVLGGQTVVENLTVVSRW